ncbi:hypothetical protein GCM10008967_04450 [Bacillus carboniphilus]|uniref:Uncharacterized protein n=1 Tax=Bacillus carboniphilus TaxID=86663 RepID=A0ABN0VTL7_9BACI
MNQAEVFVPMKKTMYVSGIILGLLGSVVALYMAVSQTSQDGEVPISTAILRFFSWILISILCASLTYFLCKKAADKRKGIILTPHGILINAAIAETGFIHWSEIKGLEIVKHAGLQYLCLTVYNQDDLILKQKTSTRLVIAINQALGFHYPVAISAKSIKMGLPELQKLVREYWQAGCRVRGSSDIIKTNHI